MMMSGINLANFAIVVSAFIISVLGLIIVIFLRKTFREGRIFFLAFFLLLVGYTSSAVINELADTAVISQISLFSNSLFSSLLIPAITVYLLRCAGEDWRHSPLFAVVAILWAVYFALLAVTQFTKGLALIDRLPTQVWSWLVAMAGMYPAYYFTGQLSPETAAMVPINALLVALAANGGYQALSRAFKTT
jgi:hypothetical protein